MAFGEFHTKLFREIRIDIIPVIVILAFLSHQRPTSAAIVNAMAEETNNTGIQECLDVGNVTKVADVGWPYHFVCADAIDAARDQNFTMYKKYKRLSATVRFRTPDGTITWNFTDTSSNLKYNKLSYPTFEVFKNMTAPYEMEYEIPEIGYCSKLKLYFQFKELPDNTTCDYPEIVPISSSTFLRSSFSFHCKEYFSAFPKIYADPEQLEYEWWYNCTKAFPNNIRITAGYELTISNTDFSDGGEYSCAVKYKGQSRLVARYDVCLKHGNDGVYSIKCEDRREVREGEDLNVTCIVNFGKGESWNSLYQMTWLKLSTVEDKKEICSTKLREEPNSGLSNLINRTSANCRTETNTKVALQKICVAHPGEGLVNSTLEDSRIQCENVKIEPRQKCYRFVPSPEERKALDRTFRLTLQIKDMKPSDEGQYVLNFTVFANDFQTQTLSIHLNKDDELTSAAMIVAICVALVLVVILLVVLSIWRRNDILWFVKKHFGAYEKDDKKYVAYLAYHYSTDNMEKLSQERTKNFVQNLADFLEKTKATTYDDHRDADPTQQRIDNIVKFQQECHRIIIILNEEYITDQWNLQKAYNAIQSMIEGGTKIVFIVFPGVKKSFKTLPGEARTALRHAMKMSITIDWSGKFPFSGSFCRRLEYALPKLDKKNEMRDKLMGTPNKRLAQTVV